MTPTDNEEQRSLVDYLEHDGRFGKEPEWHKALRAAKFCGVAPWEMEANPVWMARSLAAIAAEIEARDRRERKVRRSHGRNTLRSADLPR